MHKLIIGLLSLTLFAAACGGSAADDSPTTTAATGGDVTTTVPASGEPGPTNPDPANPQPAPVDTTVPGPKRDTPDLLPGLPSAIAATELASRLGIEVSKIQVNVVESVTWRDGSIGCPQPGMSYTQALVPGVRVILEFDGELYYYHGTSAETLSYCPTPSEPIAGDPGDA